MNKLLVAAIALSCVAISGCSTPLKVKTTDANGAVREIAVVDASGAPVEVGYSQRNVVEKIVPALDADIRRALADKVKASDFKETYVVVDDAQLKGYSQEPIEEQTLDVLRKVADSLTRDAVREIVYEAWAKKVAAEVLVTAQEEFKKGDLDAARKAVVKCKKTGCGEVDEKVQEILFATFVNLKVNPARWETVERDVRAEVKKVVEQKKFDDAKKFLVSYAAVKNELPSRYDDVDEKRTVDGKETPCFGLAALNKRLDALKASLVEQIEAARKAHIDALMKKDFDTLTEKVTAAVEKKEFSRARDMIRDVPLKGDSEYDGKFYAVRIGLLNTIVNPPQLEYLIAEADKKIDGLIAQKKYSEAIDYIVNYPYVHDRFQLILNSLDALKTAMKGMKIKDVYAEDYIASLGEKMTGIVERRAGEKEIKAAEAELAALEKALVMFHDGHLGQRYDVGQVDALNEEVKAEILALLKKSFPSMTTADLNEALAQHLAQRLNAIRSLAKDTKIVGEVKAAQIVSFSAEVNFDSQIAKAEDAIAGGRVYGMPAVLGDYARIMRCLRDGETPAKDEATTLLVGAVCLNQPLVFKEALKFGADINGSAVRDAMKRPSLLIAIEAGNAAFLPLVLKNKGDLKVTDANGNTAFHYAVRNGDIGIARTLAGAVDVKALNKAGETALFVAVRRKQLAVVKFVLSTLVGKNAEESAKLRADYLAICNGAGDSAFAVACKSDACYLLDELAKNGAKYGNEDLVKAAGAGSLGACQWLVEHHLDVNAPGVMAAAADAVSNQRASAALLEYLVAEGGEASAVPPAKADK